jgi:pilus assembly protein Flp/PilA
MLRAIKSLFTPEEGQGMVEYGLIVGLIAIIVIAVFVALGPQITALFEETVDTNTLSQGQSDVEAAIADTSTP